MGLTSRATNRVEAEVESPRTSYWRRKRNTKDEFMAQAWQKYMDAIPEKCASVEGLTELFRDLIDRMDYVEARYGAATINGQFIQTLEIGEIAAALRKTKGNVSKAAQILNISRFELNRTLGENPDLRILIDDILEERIDEVEDKVFTEAVEGNSVPDRLYIMRAHPKARARGWSEKPQLEVGGDLIINLSFDGKGEIKQITDKEREVEGEFKVITDDSN